MRARTFALCLGLAATAGSTYAQAQPARSAPAAPSGSATASPSASSSVTAPTASPPASTSASAPAAAATAPAAPSQEDRDRANALMDEGDDRAEKGDLAAALGAYQKAHAIMRVPTTGIEIARTLDKLGKLTAALAAAREVATSPPAPSEPAPFAAAREQALALATALEARVPTLTITVKVATTGARAQISLDDRKLDAAAAQAPMALDPGHYRVTADAPEHARSSVEITLKERDRAQVALALAKLAPPLPLLKRAPPPPPPPPLSPLVPIGFSVAGLGVIAGAITGALAISAANEANNLCPGGVCLNDGIRTRAQDRYGAADALAITADVSFAVALAGLAVGIYGVAATPAPSATPGTTAAPAGSAAVLIGPGRAAVRFTF